MKKKIIPLTYDYNQTVCLEQENDTSETWVISNYYQRWNLRILHQFKLLMMARQYLANPPSI